MKKTIVLLLITSLLLTQCYSTQEYLLTDYTFNEESDLKKIILSDSTVREFSFNEFSYRIKSDSLLFTFSSRREIIDNQLQFITVQDTFKIKEIRSLFVSEYNSVLTSTVLIFCGLITLGLIIGSEMFIMIKKK